MPRRSFPLQCREPSFPRCSRRSRQGYLAVSLIEGDEIQEGVYIYRYHNAEDGDVVVEQITLPSEYKKVTKFYEQM